MKLYKFRPLGDCLSHCRAKKILRTGEFWCSKFWDLNDPMEGAYLTNKDKPAIEALFDAKKQYAICSFSGEKALSSPIMWGYYANGFKGMAIEIEVPEHKDRCAPQVNAINPHLMNGAIVRMQYVDALTDARSDGSQNPVPGVLTTKLKAWRHECEYRCLCKSCSACWQGIGKLTAVYFGNPFGGGFNARDVRAHSSELRQYLARRKELHFLAKECRIGVGLARYCAAQKRVVWGPT